MLRPYGLGGHILFGDAPAGAATGDAGEIDTAGGGDIACDGGGVWRGIGRGRSLLRPYKGRYGDRTYHLADVDVGALAVQNIVDGSGLFGGDLDTDLVGLELDKQITDDNQITLAFEPAPDGSLDNRLAKRWHFNICHNLLYLLQRAARQILTGYAARSKAATMIRRCSTLCSASEPSEGLAEAARPI